MQVNVLLFAHARQLLDTDSVSLDLEQESSLSDLRNALASAHPDLEPLLSRSTFSINQNYATDEDTIPDGAEIALIPPVSGG